jgi:polysaccharide pyruvyl transferase WcaK-like protein
VSRLPTVALGYQGYGNVGDEAILSGIEQLIAGTPLEVVAVVAGPQPVAAFPAARRVTTRRLRPSLAALRAMRRARLLLISGGGLLHDHWATVVPIYLAWVAIARMLGLRVAWLGVGVGPLRRGWARWLAGRALRWSHLVTVRDPASAALVGEIAPGVAVTVVPDPAVFNLAPASGERRGVGVIVRGPAPADAALADPLAIALGRAAAILGRADPVTVLTFGGAPDRPFAGDVVDAAAAEGGGRLPIEELPPHAGIVLARLAQLEVLVSVRLHGLILGAVASTPSVGVAYDPKVASWAERLGLAGYCLQVESLSADAIVAAVARLRASSAGEEMARRLDALRGEGDRVRTQLAALA